MRKIRLMINEKRMIKMCDGLLFLVFPDGVRTGAGTGVLSLITYLPTISFIVLVKTPVRARARLAARNKRNC